MPKSMKHLCKIHARKSDAKNIENDQQMEPKRDAKTIKFQFKNNAKKITWKPGKEELGNRMSGTRFAHQPGGGP